MLEQTRQWRGVATAPWADRATGKVESTRDTRASRSRSAWPSARRVGLRLAFLGLVPLLSAFGGTAVFDGQADPLKGPAPVVWISPGQGLAPWIAQ